MLAIASINTDIHQLCLYVLGGASGRRGNGANSLRFTVFFSPERLLVSAAVSSDFYGLAGAGSAPLLSRRAGLTSVASVEECDECCLCPSDSAILA